MRVSFRCKWSRSVKTMPAQDPCTSAISGEGKCGDDWLEEGLGMISWSDDQPRGRRYTTRGFVRVYVWAERAQA